MKRNAIHREKVRAGAVECPLCSRQIVAPTDRLVVFGASPSVTAGNADAIKCPACGGVSFIVDETV